VTTDNATNNENLIWKLQDALHSSGAINSRDGIVRIPCMDHVIQQNPKRLLGRVNAKAKNKEAADV
jgi:hypothetical protein